MIIIALCVVKILLIIIDYITFSEDVLCSNDVTQFAYGGSPFLIRYECVIECDEHNTILYI